MATLKDIAKYAEVSVCTVSRYLNNNIVVKKETEERIQQAIKELGYVPNVVAKALKQNETYNIAVILPKINHLYYSEMTSGISEVLGSHHYNLFIYEVNNLNMNENEIIQLMRENMVAGVIFIGLFYDMSFRKSLGQLLEWGIPVVYMNRLIPYESCPLVYPDLEKASKMAAKHLKEKNRHRLALVHSNLPELLIKLYVQSFSQISDKKIEPMIFEIQEGMDLAKDCVPYLCNNNIDGIFVLNELNAVNLTKALIGEGVRVPEDIAVLSLGNSLMSKVSTPELTCIDLQDRLLGIKSAEVILKQIQKKKFETITVIEPFIIQRQST